MTAVAVLVVLCVLALLGTVHWYVWKRLVRDTTTASLRGRRVRRAGAAAVVVLPLLSVGAVMSGRVGAPFWLQQVLAWPGFLWLALLLYVTLALLVGEAVRPVLARWGGAGARAGSGAGDGEGAGAGADLGGSEGARLRAGAVPCPPVPPSGRPSCPQDEDGEGARPQDGAGAGPHEGDGARPQDGDGARPQDGDGARPQDGDGARPQDGVVSVAPSRRLFVSRAVGAAAALAGAATVGYGTYGVLSGPRVKRVTVPLAKLPRAAHGFRIAVVSDIHLGPILGRAHTQRIVDAINSTQPDLVAVVGDLVDGSVEDLGRAAEPLAGLGGRHGNFFVTGNHEYYSGAAPWLAHVRELGLHPLENARVEIPGFDLAGVNDVGGEAFGQGPDFARALGDRDRARASVLLAHQPVQIDQAVQYGVDLQLSGHTHGGQLWPGNLVATLANPAVAGLERYGDTQLYVSRGAGTWGPPVRVGAPSDITLVQLAVR